MKKETEYIQTNEGIYPSGTNIHQFKKHGFFWLSSKTSIQHLQKGNVFKVKHVMDKDSTFGIIQEINPDSIKVQLSDGRMVELVGLILEFLSLAKTLWLTIKAAFGNKAAKADQRELQKLNQYKPNKKHQ